MYDGIKTSHIYILTNIWMGKAHNKEVGIETTGQMQCCPVFSYCLWFYLNCPGSRIEAQLAQHSHQSLLSSSDIFRNLRYFKWTLFCDGNVKLAACAAAWIRCSHSRNDSDVSFTPDQSMFFSPTMTRHDIATQIFRELYYF